MLLDMLDMSENQVGSVTAPPLDELVEETHWLSGAPVHFDV